MDITQLGPLTPVLAIAIIVSLLKPFLERRFPVTDSLHDSAIRVFAVALGLVGLSADYLLNTSRLTGSGFEHALGNGLVAGVGAVLTYHLVTGSIFGGSGAPTAPATSVAVPAPVDPAAPVLA